MVNLPQVTDVFRDIRVRGDLIVIMSTGEKAAQEQSNKDQCDQRYVEQQQIISG